MSLGDLTEEDVEGLRNGSVTDPPLSHLLAMARAFGHRALLPGGRDRRGGSPPPPPPPPPDTTRDIARDSARLQDRERNLVLGIVRQFEGARSREEDRSRGVYCRGSVAGFGDLPPPRLLPASRIFRVHALVEALERLTGEDPCGVGVSLALVRHRVDFVVATCRLPRPVVPRPAFRAHLVGVPVAPQLEALAGRLKVQTFSGITCHGSSVPPLSAQHFHLPIICSSMARRQASSKEALHARPVQGIP